MRLSTASRQVAIGSFNMCSFNKVAKSITGLALYTSMTKQDLAHLLLP
jgi:hypothetical protein